MEVLEDLDAALDLGANGGKCSAKSLKALREFDGYITANRTYILTYGDRYHHDKPFSTAVAESTFNQVASTHRITPQERRGNHRGVNHPRRGRRC